MPPATKSQKAIRKVFKSIFKLGLEKEGGGLRKGSDFNTNFLKDLAKDQKGLDEIKKLYDDLTTNPKIQPIITGKTLSEALAFSSTPQNRFIDNLENWIKKGDIETRDIFLKTNLGITPQQIKENFPEVAPSKSKSSSSESSSSEEEEEEKEVVKSEDKAKVKKEVEKIEGKVSSGKMKMSKEEFERFQKEKQELASKMGAGAGGSSMEPPTFSPDEMMSTKEDMSEERKAQADARASRPTTGMTAEEEAELLEIPKVKSEDNVDMKMKKPNMKTEIDDLEPLPSKSDFIPPMRLGTRGKDIKDLLADISYFMKNFKSQLKREGEIFKEVDKTNIEQLRKLHNKIVGKLAPKQKKEEGKRIGIIVNADEYIREQMKKILQEQTFSSLRPDDVVIDVGSKTAEGRDNKDFGDFAVKRTIDGGLASSREAIFRYMPSENDQDVGEEGKTEKQRKKPNRISMPKSRLNNERTNAIRMNVRNPFRVPQKTMKLKYLY